MDSVTNLGLLVQLVALAVCWRAATAGWSLPAGMDRAGRRVFRWLGRRRWLAVGLVSAVALVNCLGLTALFGIPPPSVHDEFSYLLAADTFAHGRLTNPPHPLWMHFESFHIIQQPTYASKYPPVQGLLLALGQVVGGHPIVGVWLSFALACGAVCWMLQAWVPPRWAFFGGLLLTLHPSLLPLWGHSYWGGAPAMLGGTLVYGSLRRLLCKPRPTFALLFGLGLGILANSRPYEGLATSLPALAVLAAWVLRRSDFTVGTKLFRVAVPLGCTLALLGAAMASYNARVTGSPWHLPYQVHEETYAVAPLFIFQPPRPVPAYRHAVLHGFFTGLALQPYKAQQSFLQTSAAIVWKCRDLWRFYLAPVFTVPLLTLPWLLRNRWVRLALVTCGLVVFAVLLITWSNPTYCAPAACLVFFLIVQGLRQLALWRPNKRPAGAVLVAGLLLVEVGALLLAVALPGPILHRPDWSRQRSAMIAQLTRAPGKHLMVVRYAADHDPVAEWVYNEADIDAAPVVWAREMDAESDRELFTYFHDRHIWLVEADVSPPRLTPLRTGAD